MESIDRLREYLDKNVRKLPHTEWIASEPMELRPSRIYGYIDAIESEVKADRVDAYTKGYDEGFASADDWAAQHEDAMAEHGWVRLPLDADGKPIRIGDVMEERSGHTFEVASLMAFGGSDNWLVLSDQRNFSSFREPHDIRHHHAPTVEDVLQEFTDEVWNRCCEGATASDSGIDELVAEYAAKLRLAGDGE